MASFGNLFASLTLESASFMSGIKATQKQLQQTQKTFAAVGAKMQSIGKGMTVAITAPIAAAGAAILGNAREMAQSADEIARLADMSGASVEQFQRMAYAAKSVGIEQDKLGDIFKDMRDRVGDFIQTGGGPMADFFENIAPKVGITAEAFRNLSGPDALLLFTKSLQKAGLSANEMTFYMEAIASDSTMLLPLLRDNGKALEELARQAQPMTADDIKAFQEYTKAQRQLDQAFQGLTVTLVNSGLLEKITDTVKSIANFTSRLAQTNPAVVKWGIGIAAVGAALGPVLFGIGTLTKLIIPATIGVVKFAGGLLGLGAAEGVAAKGAYAFGIAVRVAFPWLAAISGAVALAYAAWENWDKIRPIIDRTIGWVKDLFQGVQLWLGQKLARVVGTVTKTVEAMVAPFKAAYIAIVGNSYVPDTIDGIRDEFARLGDVMVKPAQKGTQKAIEAFEEMRERVKGIMDNLFPDRARDTALRDQLKDLKAGLDAGEISAADYDEARRRSFRAYGNSVEQAPDPIADMLGDTDLSVLTEGIPTAADIVTDAWNDVNAANDNLKKSFADLARDVTASVRGLVDNIKSGDILGAIESVLDLIGQVKGIVGGTATPALRTYPLNGARAKGGPVMPRGNYLVGERGPEILRMGGRGGSIVPNNQLGAGTVVQLVVGAGQMFEPRVAAISGNVSIQTVLQNNKAAAYRQGRRLA